MNFIFRKPVVWHQFIHSTACELMLLSISPYEFYRIYYKLLLSM